MDRDKDKIQKGLVNLSQKLIKFESTVSRAQEREKIIDFCAALFKSSGFFIKKHHYQKNPCLVIMTRRMKRPKLLLAGHLDVVPGATGDFKPKIKGTRLYGRGAADMKAVCAVLIQVMQDLQAQKNGKSVGLILTTDEEVASYNSTAYLVDKIGHRAEVVVLPDGGYDFKLVTAQKGFLFFTLSAKGAGAHGSRPWQGESAIKKIFKAYKEMRKYIPEPKHEHDWRPSLTMTKITGGEADNKIPASCFAGFDLRFTEDKSVAHWQKYLEKLSKKHGLELALSRNGDAFAVDVEHEHVVKFRKISHKVLNKHLKLTPETGASDASYFSVHNIPVIITCPKGGNTHADNEWVDINSLYKFYQIIRQFVAEVG